MTDSNVVAVTDATFAEHVLKAVGPVLVKFEADWCGPCKAMKPMINELAQQYAGRLTIATVDIDVNNQTPMKFAVRGVPTVLLFDQGQVVGQKVGLPRKHDLQTLIDSRLQA